MNKYCICVSGLLGNVVLRKLVQDGMIIIAVLTDYKSDSIINFCAEREINVFNGNPRNGKASQWLNENRILFDNILSVNYLYILEEDLLNRAKFAINFHGSLLPKYRGRTPHVWAIINGEKECGVTAHLMNPRCDDGDIIKQIHVSISEEDTGASILRKYSDIYPTLVGEIVKLIDSGGIVTSKQDFSKATYYGKRTPADGGIDWGWQKDRIRNWVRAQSRPYPGAFTHIDGVKVTIHKVTFCDYGYVDTIPNGTVLSISDEGPIVKTQNGAIVLKDFETEAQIHIGQIFKTIKKNE